MIMVNWVIGNNTQRSTPTKVGNLSAVKQLELGYDHSCALKTDGTGVVLG